MESCSIKFKLRASSSSFSGGGGTLIRFADVKRFPAPIFRSFPPRAVSSVIDSGGGMSVLVMSTSSSSSVNSKSSIDDACGIGGSRLGNSP